MGKSHGRLDHGPQLIRCSAWCILAKNPWWIYVNEERAYFCEGWQAYIFKMKSVLFVHMVLSQCTWYIVLSICVMLVYKLSQWCSRLAHFLNASTGEHCDTLDISINWVLSLVMGVLNGVLEILPHSQRTHWRCVSVSANLKAYIQSSSINPSHALPIDKQD